MTAYHDEHENEYDLRAAQAKADPMTGTAAPDSIRIATQFADMYRAGAHGAEMDFDAAQKLALSIDDILAALRASPAPDRVSVKPLEWSQNWRNDPLTAFAEAKSIDRTYTVDHDGPRFYVSTSLLLSEIGSDAIANCETFDEAKAAAQADYEKRIRSALSEASK